MAVTVLSDDANEESTYIVVVQFQDENGDSVIPNSATWSLRDTEGNIVNDRSAVSILDLATTVSIVLSGADTSYFPVTKVSRTFTIKAIYNSTTYGNNLPLNDECTFDIQPLSGVVDA